MSDNFEERKPWDRTLKAYCDKYVDSFDFVPLYVKNDKGELVSLKMELGGGVPNTAIGSLLGRVIVDSATVTTDPNENILHQAVLDRESLDHIADEAYRFWRQSIRALYPQKKGEKTNGD